MTKETAIQIWNDQNKSIFSAKNRQAYLVIAKEENIQRRRFVRGRQIEHLKTAVKAMIAGWRLDHNLLLLMKNCWWSIRDYMSISEKYRWEHEYNKQYSVL